LSKASPACDTRRMKFASAVARRRIRAATCATYLCAMLASASLAMADQPSAQTLIAFDDYVRGKEAAPSLDLARGRFLWIDRLDASARPVAYARLKGGEILIEPGAADRTADREIPGGLIHDWRATEFVRGTSLARVLSALENYDRDAEYYAPQVVRSRLLSRDGDDFRIFLRLRQTHGITVVFDTDYDVRYAEIDSTHATSRSYSTRIVEIENAGKADERERTGQEDRGLLWRLDTYWRFHAADGGVFIECDAISLTRDVPTGLGWLIHPFIEKIPRESLQFTLDATRRVLTEGEEHAQHANGN
jgi:hypothetical protein